jgi:hypothetical protein
VSAAGYGGDAEAAAAAVVVVDAAAAAAAECGDGAAPKGEAAVDNGPALEEKALGHDGVGQSPGETAPGQRRRPV